MKCLIYSPPEQTSWLKDFFPGVNPFYLKILNKPLLEYYIDFCVLAGISEIKVVNSETGTDLEDYFNEGRQWGVNLTYGFAKPEDSLKQVLRKNRSFCRDSDLLVINGYQFLKYDKQASDYSFKPCSEATALRFGNCYLYFLPADSEIFNIDFSTLPICQENRLEIAQIDSIKSYFKLNMNILTEERNSYFLPGYNNEDGVYLGKNVIDKKSTKYERPLILGNNVQIQMNTVIGPNAVIGDNVIIDHSTRVENSIIYEHSYIGSELEIDNKIVFKKRLIDPESGEVMQIVDSFLLSDIQGNLFHNTLQIFVNSLFALVLILLNTVPYFLMLVVCKLTGMKTQKAYCYRNKDTATCICKTYSTTSFNFFKRFFYRFSFDLYPQYFRVLQGHLLLVGNYLIPRSGTALNYLQSMPYYQPGVFSYPGSMLHNHNHENFINDELEYCHTHSFWLDIKIIIQSCIARLFSEWCAIDQYLGENNHGSN